MTGQTDISVELSAYLDGQSPPDVAKWVDRAVTENPELARQLHDLRRIRTILRAVEPARPKPDFVAKVIAEAKRRGLMRHVLREQLVRGIFRLASAAAAVLLLAVVAGVALQSFIHKPLQQGELSRRDPQPPIVAMGEGVTSPGAPAKSRGGNAGEDHFSEGGSAPLGTTLAALPGEGRKSSGHSSITANGKLLREKSNDWYIDGDCGLEFGPENSDARTLELSVANLGAAAKEVETVLALAGVVRTAGKADTIDKLVKLNSFGYENSSSNRNRNTQHEYAASAPAAPSNRDAESRPKMFYRVPGGADELRFVVVAQPDCIEAVTRRLGDLRPRNCLDKSGNGLCAGGLDRPGPNLPKAASSPSPAAPKAKPAGESRPTTEPYHTAEIERLNTNSQTLAGQRETETAPTSQRSQQAAQRAGHAMEVLIITVRPHPPTTNRLDPARNTRQ